MTYSDIFEYKFYRVIVSMMSPLYAGMFLQKDFLSIKLYDDQIFWVNFFIYRGEKWNSMDSLTFQKKYEGHNS